jgi:hypothetical protein
MANKKYTVKNLENRLDRTSAANEKGRAILEPYVDMGQPREAPPSDTACTSMSAQPSSRCQALTDPTDYAALPPHPQYGNIYTPNHIEHLGGHAFRVVQGQGEQVEPITSRVCWSDALAVTQWLNSGEHPPAVDIIVARSLKGGVTA